MDSGLVDFRNVLFSISSGALSQNERDQLAQVQCSWVLLNTRLGRFFVDIIGPVNRLQNIQDKLVELGRDPIVIGIFDGDGVLLNAPNKAEWLKVARDVDGIRPTAWVDVHKWFGWGEKVIP